MRAVYLEKFFYAPGKLYEYHYHAEYPNHSFSQGTVNAKNIKKAFEKICEFIKIENAVKCRIWSNKTKEAHEIKLQNMRKEGGKWVYFPYRVL